MSAHTGLYVSLRILILNLQSLTSEINCNNIALIINTYSQNIQEVFNHKLFQIGCY